VRDAVGRGGRAHRLISLAVDDADLEADRAQDRDAARRGRASRHPLDQICAEQLAAQRGPAFDASLALEFLGFSGPDVKEGIASLRDKAGAGVESSSPL